MSAFRRSRRKQQTETAKHLAKLSDILGEFYTFLEKKPQPSDEEVRSEFIRQENRWKRYCVVHKLSGQASLMFNREVSEAWHNRYGVKNEKVEN